MLWVTNAENTDYASSGVAVISPPKRCAAAFTPSKMLGDDGRKLRRDSLAGDGKSRGDSIDDIAHLANSQPTPSQALNEDEERPHYHPRHWNDAVLCPARRVGSGTSSALQDGFQLHALAAALHAHFCGFHERQHLQRFRGCHRGDAGPEEIRHSLVRRIGLG